MGMTNQSKCFLFTSNLASGPGAIGGLDVQAIMDRAIELRRKAIEESESEEEGEGDEADWSDEG